MNRAEKALRELARAAPAGRLSSVVGGVVQGGERGADHSVVARGAPPRGVSVLLEPGPQRADQDQVEPAVEQHLASGAVRREFGGQQGSREGHSGRSTTATRGEPGQQPVTQPADTA